MSGETGVKAKVVTSTEPVERTPNKTVLKAIVLGGSAEVPASKAEVDEWQEVAASTVPPPYDPKLLAELPEYSAALGPAIEAMVTNTAGFGHRIVSALRISDSDDKLRKEVQREVDSAANFFSAAYIGGTTFDQLRIRTRRDRETVGYGFWEVIRDTKGKVAGFNYLPATEMRLGRITKDPIKLERTVPHHEDGVMSTRKQVYHRRVRTYCQSLGAKKVWFKDYGDPRTIDPRTGDVNDKLSKAEAANEVIYWPLILTKTAYGLPRYIGNLLSVTGSRSRDEMCYYLLRHNNVPALALLVSNGNLTDPSITRIQEFLDTAVKGEGSFAKVVIIEAESAFDGFEGTPNMKMEMKPLIEAQHTDAMFSNYDQENHDKLLQSFRLPPVFIGRSKDYNRATADTARKLADEQVFAPERSAEEAVINQLLMEMGYVWARFRVSGPNITHNEDIVNVMSHAEKAGGMTPAISRRMVEDIMGQDLGEVTGIDPDIPFTAQMAELVKNLGKPNEPSQQVTAYKALLTAAGVHDDLGEYLFGRTTT